MLCNGQSFPGIPELPCSIAGTGPKNKIILVISKTDSKILSEIKIGYKYTGSMTWGMKYTRGMAFDHSRHDELKLKTAPLSAP